MTAAPILILDDVATGKFTDGSLELIYQVIDHRSCNLLPTLLTSNLTADGIDARWGEKIVSRILERGHGRMIEIDGQNHRMRAA
jgi:DNA replication protein DnaC